jgi:hypothetical protein
MEKRIVYKYFVERSGSAKTANIDYDSATGGLSINVSSGKAIVLTRS